MREFQEKENLKNNLFRLDTNFSWRCFLALIFPTVKVYRKSEIGAVKSKEIKEEIIKLEKRNAELGAEVARLESESGQRRRDKKEV